MIEIYIYYCLFQEFFLNWLVYANNFFSIPEFSMHIFGFFS